MSFANLPDVTFCETDASKIEADVLKGYEDISGTKLYPGNPVRLFLESLAYVIAQQRFSIDWSAKQNLLAYASGEHLDHLGILTDTTRLSASSAMATVRFYSSGGPGAVFIPAGTRVSPDGKLLFATTIHGQIDPAAEYVDLPVACTTPGSSGNGFVAGQISKMVDPVAGVSVVSNITMSLGGADIETDDNFRERIRLSVGAYSEAGPREAYVFWAKSAHQDIVDVSVESPEPGVVEVRPLMAGGELPSQEVLDLVTAALDPDTVVPLTDDCRVLAPDVVPYQLQATYYIGRNDASTSPSIQTAVTRAVAEYVAWQRAALGRDISPDKLISLLQIAGAKRVAIASPAFTTVGSGAIARETSVSVLYGGMEDA
jgi:phage-related baseplate assembly protein